MGQQTLDDKIASLKDQVVQWRRYFHENPELSYQEFQTSAYVEEVLKSFGSFEVSRPTPTSVMARLIGKNPGKTLALRADIDALPIQEKNTFSFASKVPGVMHACGHDSHTAVLLGVAKIIAAWQDQLHGEIRLFFQHAEESSPGGAKEMIKAGVMEGVDWVYGAHLLSSLELNKIGISYGPMMSSSDTFSILVKGTPGHAAYPHQSVDAITIGAQIITNLQHIVARNTDPLKQLVLSITQIHGGAANNVFPEIVEISGTVRSFDLELREEVKENMERIIGGLASAHGAEYDFTYEPGYDPVINDEHVTKMIEETITESYGAEALELLQPFMGSEDFSGYQHKAPGTFFMVGARNEEKGITYPHHHSLFTVDEEAMPIAMKIMIQSIFKFLRVDFY